MGPLARQSQIVQMEANRVQRPLDILRYSPTVFKNKSRCATLAGECGSGREQALFIPCTHAAEKKKEAGVNARLAFPSEPEDIRGKDDGTDCGRF